jgi:hypothetical protein
MNDASSSSDVQSLESGVRGPSRSCNPRRSGVRHTHCLDTRTPVRPPARTCRVIENSAMRMLSGLPVFTLHPRACRTSTMAVSNNKTAHDGGRHASQGAPSEPAPRRTRSYIVISTRARVLQRHLELPCVVVGAVQLHVPRTRPFKRTRGRRGGAGLVDGQPRAQAAQTPLCVRVCVRQSHNVRSTLRPATSSWALFVERDSARLVGGVAGAGCLNVRTLPQQASE